ncbi:MAG: NrfD/PsrC family molybdoenzyme membrane anchor subunit [Candidatus Heimdallarchaeota archaeon]
MDSWGGLITLYLFLSGLGAGLFAAIAGLESFNPSNTFKRTFVRGVSWSLILITLGIIMLALSLGHPERAYKMIFYPHLTSPISWGTILIITLMVLGLIYWFAQTGILIKNRVPSLWEMLQRHRTVIVTLGGMIAFMIGTYSGVLLTYTSHSLWNNPTVPLLFLVSTLGMGYALFLFIAKSTREIEQTRLWQHLPKLMVILGVLELLIVLAYMVFLPIDARTALLNIGSIYGTLFTLIFLGGGVLLGKIGLPLLGMRISGSLTLYLSTLLILVGGFVLRYVVIILGPML